VLNPPARRRHDHEHSEDDGPSVRVLLVDDDDNFRVWLAALMRRAGFTVATAIDGTDALEMLRAERFDLLIADYHMPRVDGFDLIRAIRRDPALSHQYAVMLTSREDLESKVAALTIGYDDFLTKSCTEIEVLAKVVAAKRMVSRQRVLAAAAREWQALATHDELTGVARRHTLFSEGKHILSDQRPLGVAIIDLDEFKPINDTYGHLTGDHILRDIGAFFLGRTRANDLIGRYGGDEFLLLVPDLPLEELSGAATRIVRELEQLRWTVDGKTFGIKATFGIGHSSLLPKGSLEQLLEAADRDLYAKKWIKKHPGERLDLYEYQQQGGGAVVPITPSASPEAPAPAADAAPPAARDGC
jgi:diguanylate cyclase (GGDEF)-like protein